MERIRRDHVPETISKSVRAIEQYAFHRCDKLKKVSFSSGGSLEIVGDHALYGNNRPLARRWTSPKVLKSPRQRSESNQTVAGGDS